MRVAPVLVLLGAVTVTALTGCRSIRIGTPPHVEHLASLRPGVSTTMDVLMALGEPRGRGAARFSPKYAPRKIWLYEYTKATSGLGGGDIALTILLVFIEADRYEGYLWFSSTHDIKRIGGIAGTDPLGVHVARSGGQP